MLSQVVSMFLQFFMAVSLVAGVTMLVFTIGYRHRLRKMERLGRYVLATLVIYSVSVRFLIILPGEFQYMWQTSIGFDVLYLAMCIIYNFNILARNGKND